MSSRGKRVALWLLAIPIALAAWYSIQARSVRVPLTDDGLRLTFTVYWALEMEQELCVSRGACWPLLSTKKSAAIWKKPYYGGGKLYRSKDGRTLIMGHQFGVWTLDLQTLEMRSHCTADQALQSVGPVSANQNANMAKLLTAESSRFFPNLDFAGEFKVIRRNPSEIRYDDVDFIPAKDTPEENKGLGGSCG